MSSAGEGEGRAARGFATGVFNLTGVTCGEADVVGGTGRAWAGGAGVLSCGVQPPGAPKVGT